MSSPLQTALATAKNALNSESAFDAAIEGAVVQHDNMLSGALGIAIANSPAPLSVAGAHTLTAAELLAQGGDGRIVMDPGGAVALTFPTAALLVAAMIANGRCQVGDLLRVNVTNGGDAAEVITLTAGTGGGWDTNQTGTSQVIPEFGAKAVDVRITNITPGFEAYVMYA